MKNKKHRQREKINWNAFPMKWVLLYGKQQTLRNKITVIEHNGKDIPLREHSIEFTDYDMMKNFIRDQQLGKQYVILAYYPNK